MADARKQNGGKRANSGRKSKAEELGVAQLFEDCWTIEQRREVIQALHEKARVGNEKCAALLFAYIYGKPTETVKHSNPDGSPLLAPIAEAMVKVYGGK